MEQSTFLNLKPMELTEEQKQIYNGEICPYCKKPSKLIESEKIYGFDCGLLYICEPCNAYVGVHKDTTNALGRLANKELRQKKKEAHKAFDEIWKSGYMKRRESYKWLSLQLGIPKDYTHIGMFSVKTCERVVEVSKQFLDNIKNL